MQKKKLAKLWVLKLMVLMEPVVMGAVFAGCAHVMGFHWGWGAALGVVNGFFLMAVDPREWKSKKIITFPSSTYLQEQHQPQHPESSRRP